MNLQPDSFLYRFAKQFEYLFGTFFIPVNAFMASLDFANFGPALLANYVLALVFLYWELISLLIKEHRKELTSEKIKNYNTVYTFTMAYMMAGIMICCQMFVSGNFWIASYLSLMALAFVAKFLLLKRIQPQL